MSPTINILASHSVLHSVEREATQLPDLKHEVTELCGTRIRRVDRYIELCLLGALSCVRHHQVPNTTAVYLATRGGAVETPSQAMSSIFDLKQPPKPLHFVNTLGNTACFYLTRGLNISGQALVVSQEHLSFEAALFQACVDMQSGVVGTALVGGIDEVGFPVAQQAARLGAPHAQKLLEGSHWLLLSSESPTGVKVPAHLARPGYFQDIKQLAAWLGEQPPGALQHCFALSASEQQALQTTGRRLLNASATERHQALEHGVYSGAALIDLITEFCAAHNSLGETCIHLARTEGIYCAVVIRP